MPGLSALAWTAASSPNWGAETPSSRERFQFPADPVPAGSAPTPAAPRAGVTSTGTQPMSSTKISAQV